MANYRSFEVARSNSLGCGPLQILMYVSTALTLLFMVTALLAAPLGSESIQLTNAPSRPNAAGRPLFEPVPQKGHTGLITGVDYSRDGRFLLTASLDGTARLWDTHSDILIRVFDAAEAVKVAAFIPDGKRIATHDEHGHLKIFDMATGTLLQTVTTKWTYFPKIRPFSDGRRILVSCDNKDIRIVDLDSGQTLKQFNECPADPYARTNIDLSHDGRLMITSCVNGQVQIRDLVSGERIVSHKMPVASEHGTAFLSDGRHAVLFSSHGTLHHGDDNGIDILDYRSGKIVASHKGPKDLFDFAVSENGKTLAILVKTSLSTGEIQLRDLWSYQVRQRFSDGISDNRGIVRLSPDGSTLVAPGDLSSVSVFDVATKKRTCHLSSEDSGGIRLLASRPKRWQVASASGDGNIYLFDVASASLQKAYSAKVEHITALDYSPDGRFLANVDLTNPNTYRDHSFMGARIWDAATGKQIFKNVQQRSLVRAAKFSDDGQLLLLGDRNEISVMETKSWRRLGKVAYDEDPRSVSISSDKTRVALARDSSTDDGIFDVRTGKRLEKFPIERVVHAQYLADGRRMLFVNYSGEVELWDLPTKRRLHSYMTIKREQDRTLSSGLELASDGKRFVGVSRGKTLDVWEVDSGKLVQRFALHNRGVRDAVFLPNPDYVATSDTLGALRVWNVKTGTSMSWVADGHDWIVYTEDGYFDGSRRSGRLVAAVSGLSSFRIDQMASRNNRPDIILQRMGLGSPELIRHYASLHQRRLKKLGLSEADLDGALLNAPTVTITSANKVERSLQLEFDAEDASSELARYNVYVNDVPVFGAAGKPLSGRRQHIAETVVLAAGENDIEVGVLNRQGHESMRPSVSMPYLEKTRSELYFLGFGVSRYRNSEFDLKYAAKDVNDLAALFTRNTGAFAKVNVKVYTDQAVTPRAVAEAKAFLANARVDDMVVLFAAGHGLYAPHSTSDYFFLTHDTDLNRLNETAVPFENLEELLSGIAPRKKLFLLDTCYSGEEGKDASAAAFALAGSRGLVSRGIRRKALDGSAVPRDQQQFSNRDRFIYNDLFRRSGAIVLSSSKGSELSYEKDDIQNGLFTEYVLRALSSNVADTDKDHRVSSDELRSYVESSVSTASGGLQNPVVDRDNIEMRLSLPLQ